MEKSCSLVVCSTSISFSSLEAEHPYYYYYYIIVHTEYFIFPLLYKEIASFRYLALLWLNNKCCLLFVVELLGPTTLPSNKWHGWRYLISNKTLSTEGFSF